MNPTLLNKLLKIRQGNAIWQCTLRRAPVWITPKKEPTYRPFILMVVDQDSQMVIKTEIVEKRPAPQAVLDHLFDTMQGNILTLRQKHRPACINIDDAELAQICTPQLAELGIRCEHRASLPQLNDALHELEAAINHQLKPIPGLLSIQGASVPLVAELYAASAEFYRQAPWRWIENFVPIEVRYPADSERVRYALVLGSGGEFYGLSLYESLADLDVVFSRTTEQPPSRPITWISLILEEATTMSFEDLDAIERYGWAVAGNRAYPLAMKTTFGRDESEIPTSSELAWLAAVLRAIPVFLTKHLHADRGLPQPAQTNLPLPDVHSNQQIALRYPARAVPTVKSIAQTEDPELEAYIADWHWDEKSHEFAQQMGKFLFQFLDSLDESNLSEQTIRKHESNCWCIGWLESGYGYHDTFSPAIFLGGPNFDIEFKRKVSDSKYSINSYEATWRRLEKYIYSLGYENPYSSPAPALSGDTKTVFVPSRAGTGTTSKKKR
jgi:hypothetical protein